MSHTLAPTTMTTTTTTRDPCMGLKVLPPPTITTTTGITSTPVGLRPQVKIKY